jgi:hypothetical protein
MTDKINQDQNVETPAAASPVISDDDDEVTDENVAALSRHVEKHFGLTPELILIDGPAWQQ